MRSTRLDKTAELIARTQQALAICPSQHASGEALVLIREAIKELREAQAEMRVSSSERWELSWVKWYKSKPSQLYPRWDDAFKAAVLEMSLFFAEFTAKITQVSADGEAFEWTIDAKSQATLVVRRK